MGLFGRQEEAAALHRLCAATKRNRGAFVLLSGEAGVGKSSLVEHVLSESGLAVFRGRARQEATAAYGSIAAALREALRRDAAALEGSGPLAPFLALILPELGIPPEEETAPDTVIEAIRGGLASLAERRPTVLVLEDLQWADNATLEGLPILTEGLADVGLLFIGIARSDELSRTHPLRKLRHELRRGHGLQEINLSPLDRHDTGRLAESVLQRPLAATLVQELFDRTQGVPLYVEELAAAMTMGGHLQEGAQGLELVPGREIPVPETLRDAVLQRLQTLSPQARTLLEIAAVAGLDFALDFVAQLAGHEDGLEELMERGFLVEIAPGRAAFRHALTREAVLGEILWSRRRSWHRRIAAALEARHALPENIAPHWLAANELTRARQALLASARRACQLHAYHDAVEAGQRALDVWPQGEDEASRLEALENMAHCAQLSGRLPDAVKALGEITDSPHVARDPRRRAEAWRSLATVHGLRGSWVQSVEARHAAAAAFEEANLPAESALEFLALAARATATLQFDAALEEARRATRLAVEGNRVDVQARALGLEGNILAMQGQFQKGRDAARAGLALALAHNHNEAAAEIYRRLGSVHEYGSDYSGAQQAYDMALDFCRRQGVDSQATICLGCMSWILLQTGDWKRGIEISRTAIDDEVTPTQNPGALCVLGLIRAFRGETKQARRNLQNALEAARRTQTLAMEIMALWGLAFLAEAEDAVADAHAYYGKMLALWEKTQDRHDALIPLSHAVTFYAARGLEAEAARCTEALASIATSTGNAEALAMLACALGEVALLQGNAEEERQHFQQALTHLDKLDLPLQRARVELRAGKAAARAERRDEALRHFTAAYRVARKLGARPLASEIAGQLESLGESVEDRRRAEAPSRVDAAGLTRRQLEVLRRMAAGLTNKEIARALFVSPRTVDMHVAHILDRLDCRSRTEAVARAGELGLLDS